MQMGEACADLDARLEAVAAAAAPLPSRMPRLRDPAICRRSAQAIDALLVNVSRGHSALDLAIGEGLHALSLGDRAMDLKYSNVYDYAREELGIAASTAAKMERLAERLADFPVLREAVLRGELTVRKAEIIAPIAVRGDEVRWVLWGKAETVRSLKVKVARPRESDEEDWRRFSAEVAPEKRPILDEGLDCAGKLLGTTATKMQRVQIWGEEFLGSHPEPGDDQMDDLLFAKDELEPLKEWLERQNREWGDLASAAPVQAPEFGHETDPWRIDRKLKRFTRMREGWDEALGHLALLVKSSRAWEALGFASFGHYCEERLGMSERTVSQRVSLERSLQRIPLLRQAVRENRINYEKARLLARHADAASLPGWIEKAEKMTCVALRRALQGKEEAQMCARGTFTVWMTVRVADIVKAAFRAARLAAKRCLSAGECVVAIAQHFVQTWGPALAEQPTLQRRIRARDKGFCQVPGCSRAAAHAHHIKHRSQGGSDDPSNLISLCAAHHLRGIHDGRMSVTGAAPDGLVWEFGLRRSS